MEARSILLDSYAGVEVFRLWVCQNIVGGCVVLDKQVSVTVRREVNRRYDLPKTPQTERLDWT